MAVDIALWKECLAALPKQPPRQFPFRCGDVDGNRVFLVDANEIKVRKDGSGEGEHPHMDFIEGANDLEALWVRREFGKKVLLVDGSDTGRHNWVMNLYHEAHERRDMSKGMSYNAAHDRANAGEKKLRLAVREHNAARRGSIR